jgi:hypothetical protein
MGFNRRIPSGTVLATLIVAILLPTGANAIPAFAQQYATSCATCHIDFPKLNDFGKAFKDAGFKFPKDDAAVLDSSRDVGSTGECGSMAQGDLARDHTRYSSHWLSLQQLSAVHRRQSPAVQLADSGGNERSIRSDC